MTRKTKLKSKSKTEQIKELKEKVESLKSYNKVWDNLHNHANNTLRDQLIKSRKSIDILLPKVDQEELTRLLAELYDLREKSNWDKTKEKLKKKVGFK